MSHLLYVFLGGGFGAGARHLVNLAALRLFGSGFPFGTLIVNIIGSLVMGLLIGYLARRAGGTPSGFALFLTTGFLGGFTTFSAFSLDVANMWSRGATASMVFYVVTSVLISIAAVFAGLWLMRQAA